MSNLSILPPGVKEKVQTFLDSRWCYPGAYSGIQADIADVHKSFYESLKKDELSAEQLVSLKDVKSTIYDGKGRNIFFVLGSSLTVEKTLKLSKQALSDNQVVEIFEEKDGEKHSLFYCMSCTGMINLIKNYSLSVDKLRHLFYHYLEKESPTSTDYYFSKSLVKEYMEIQRLLKVPPKKFFQLLTLVHVEETSDPSHKKKINTTCATNRLLNGPILYDTINGLKKLGASPEELAQFISLLGNIKKDENSCYKAAYSFIDAAARYTRSVLGSSNKPHTSEQMDYSHAMKELGQVAFQHNSFNETEEHHAFFKNLLGSIAQYRANRFKVCKQINVIKPRSVIQLPVINPNAPLQKGGIACVK
jgi:hypothetical protein